MLESRAVIMQRCHNAPSSNILVEVGVGVRIAEGKYAKLLGEYLFTSSVLYLVSACAFTLLHLTKLHISGIAILYSIYVE